MRWWKQLWRRPRSWIVLVLAVGCADALTPTDWAFVVAHLILLPLAWCVLHRRFITLITAIQSVTVASVGLLHVFEPMVGWLPWGLEEASFERLDPARLWTFAALMATGYFHIYLQGRLRTRLHHQRTLQHRVRRRSHQIRRVNRALRNEVSRRQETQHKLDQSETTFQSLIDRMQLQVARKSFDGVFTYANEQFCHDIGLTPAEVIGSTDDDLFDAAIAAKYRADDLNVMMTGKVVDKVEIHPGPDGRSGYAQVFKAPEYDQNGRCIGIQVIFWDITEKHRGEIALRDSEARKRALFDAAGDAVLLVDKDRDIVEANPSASRLLQIGGGRLVGRPLNDLIAPQAIAWDELSLTSRHELRLRRGDGTAFESEVSLHAIPVGNATGQAVIIRDVTLQSEAFEAMREAKAAAEQANLTKTQFMAGISHELRTPLGGIRGLTELLSQQTLPTASRRYVNLIAQNTELLHDVIEDILDFAAIEAGRVAIDPVPIELHDVVGEAFGCLAVRVSDKPVRLCLSIDPHTPRHVVADAKRIRQIIVNLAGNAIKFTPRGEVSVRLSSITPPAEAEPNNDLEWFEVNVSDTGIGIAAENQSRIFDAFEQADRGTNKRFGGTGLGLAIARGLTQRMGGDITLTSQPGQGSQFRCVLGLPLLKTPVADESTTLTNPPEHSIAVVWVGNETMHDAIAETLLHAGAIVRAPSTLERDLKQVHWILTDQTADSAWRIRARKSTDRVLWITRAGETVPRRARRDDAVVIEPLHPDELRRWLNGQPLLQSSRGQRRRRPAARLAKLSTTSPLSTTELATETESNANPRASGSNDSQSTSQSTVDSTPQPLELLVVDDSVTNRLVIHDQLVAAGHHVETLESGTAAIDRVEAKTFDCVMMDLQMPDMDGTEATRVILARAAEMGRDSPPIIALTAHVTDQHRRLCRDAGMVGYITKPIDLDLLLREIDRVLANRVGPVSTKVPSTTKTPVETKTAESTHGQDFDWRKQLAKHCGNDEATMDSVCDAFLMEVPGLLKTLDQGARRGNAKQIQTASHTLKSCLRYFAPPDDVAAASEVEELVKDSDWVEQLKTKSSTTNAKEANDHAVDRLRAVATRWLERIGDQSTG